MMPHTCCVCVDLQFFLSKLVRLCVCEHSCEFAACVGTVQNRLCRRMRRLGSRAEVERAVARGTLCFGLQTVQNSEPSVDKNSVPCL